MKAGVALVVAVRGLEMSLSCRDYNQAVKWARMECKSYKIAAGFIVERWPGLISSGNRAHDGIELFF